MFALGLFALLRAFCLLLFSRFQPHCAVAIRSLALFYSMNSSSVLSSLGISPTAAVIALFGGLALFLALFFVAFVLYLRLMGQMMNLVSQEHRPFPAWMVWLSLIPILGGVWSNAFAIRLSMALQAEGETKGLFRVCEHINVSF